MVSESDAAAELVNPAAAGTLMSEYPAVGHNLRLDDFRPVAGSALAAAGFGALPAGPEGPEPPVEPPPPDPEPEPTAWREGLEERERLLLANCEVYAAGAQGGLPGHMLMLLTAKLAGMLDAAVEDGL
jgi:hypothetical protein